MTSFFTTVMAKSMQYDTSLKEVKNVFNYNHVFSISNGSKYIHFRVNKASKHV